MHMITSIVSSELRKLSSHVSWRKRLMVSKIRPKRRENMKMYAYHPRAVITHRILFMLFSIDRWLTRFHWRTWHSFYDACYFLEYEQILCMSFPLDDGYLAWWYRSWEALRPRKKLNNTLTFCQNLLFFLSIYLFKNLSPDLNDNNNKQKQ